MSRLEHRIPVHGRRYETQSMEYATTAKKYATVMQEYEDTPEEVELLEDLNRWIKDALEGKGEVFPGIPELPRSNEPPQPEAEFTGTPISEVLTWGTIWGDDYDDVRRRVCVRALRAGECAMFLTRSEYDRGVNTFSPEGRLFQVEYAIEAIKLGSTAVGLKTRHGCILAVEKRITSTLLEPTSVEKIMEIDSHIGCAMSGLIADARTLVEHARHETQHHRFTYNEPMSVESATQAVCDLALRFGEGDDESMSRPFGVSLLIAGHDEHGPALYHTDPSGTFWQCNAKAIGSGSEGADTTLQESYNKDMTLEEAETVALSTLKQVMEEKVTSSNVDIAKVAPEFHLYTPAEVEGVISRLAA